MNIFLLPKPLVDRVLQIIPQHTKLAAEYSRLPIHPSQWTDDQKQRADVILNEINYMRTEREMIERLAASLPEDGQIAKTAVSSCSICQTNFQQEEYVCRNPKIEEAAMHLTCGAHAGFANELEVVQYHVSEPGCAVDPSQEGIIVVLSDQDHEAEVSP